VQLAAYASLDKALAHADRLAADAGVPSLVTPVPQNGNGPVWYRVLAGSYATRAGAGEARADLWRRGIAAEGIGDLLRAPYSYRAPSDASLDVLRRHGLPAVRWSNGVILLGAFESPEQAAFTQAACSAPACARTTPSHGDTMRLSRLELSGFKSFAGSVELPFEQGVTAIVGPNGCGKSNISDAVRWVLGEQSPRLLRGGKMEDVIFQGSTGRRPVNVAEVSLVFDNSDGSLPIAYQEVVVTRRLSRSGQSDYLLNRSPVRLRDIQDLLRGTGLGADAAVVMEAKMIEALLSEKAEERRALFEEAAGIGLYRDRKKSTERRLEETAADLARLEDLIAEVQTQVRSLARQRGRAERYGKMIEERFGIAMTLVRRELEDFDLALGSLGVRARELAAAMPAARERLSDAERQREARVQARHTAEARRTEVERRLADAKLEAGRLENDLALAAERLSNAGQRRQTAAEERVQAERRAAQAEREHEAAATERTAAHQDLAAVQTQLEARTSEEDDVRGRLSAERHSVRELEEALQRRAETARALEIEGGALDRERSELREQLALRAAERQDRDTAAQDAARDAAAAAERVSRDAQAAVHAVEALQHTRRHLAALQEQEMAARSARRGGSRTRTARGAARCAGRARPRARRPRARGSSAAQGEAPRCARPTRGFRPHEPARRRTGRTAPGRMAPCRARA
jgi:chromosome segregation protein